MTSFKKTVKLKIQEVLLQYGPGSPVGIAEKLDEIYKRKERKVSPETVLKHLLEMASQDIVQVIYPGKEGIDGRRQRLFVLKQQSVATNIALIAENRRLRTLLAYYKEKIRKAKQKVEKRPELKIEELIAQDANQQ